MEDWKYQVGILCVMADYVDEKQDDINKDVLGRWYTTSFYDCCIFLLLREFCELPSIALILNGCCDTLTWAE